VEAQGDVLVIDGSIDETSQLLDLLARAHEPPAMACADCGAPMVFNDFPERYFSFLSV
jgi:hypothetical protein